MSSPDTNPQSEEFARENQFPSPDEIIKITKIRSIIIETLKRKPILLSQVLQTVDDINTTGIRLSGLAWEIFRGDYHDFRFYFIAPYSDEDICRLAYTSNDKRGLHIEAFSGRSYVGEYYQAQLRAVARSRKIPFEMIEWQKVKGIPQSGKLTLLPPQDLPQL